MTLYELFFLLFYSHGVLVIFLVAYHHSRLKLTLKKDNWLYATNAGPPIGKLFNIWHFMNKVALFRSQLCVGLDV